MNPLASIFILALFFNSTQAVSPMLVHDFDTAEQCGVQFDKTVEWFASDTEEIYAEIKEAGADDLLVGCFTPEEAGAILSTAE